MTDGHRQLRELQRLMRTVAEQQRHIARLNTALTAANALVEAAEGALREERDTRDRLEARVGTLVEAAVLAERRQVAAELAHRDLDLRALRRKLAYFTGFLRANAGSFLDADAADAALAELDAIRQDEYDHRA